MNRHTFYVCDGDHLDGRHCPFCDGGLSACTVCNGGEASLPTYCPGEPMDETTQQAVMRGEIDYFGKRLGWIKTDANFRWFEDALAKAIKGRPSGDLFPIFRRLVAESYVAGKSIADAVQAWKEGEANRARFASIATVVEHKTNPPKTRLLYTGPSARGWSRVGRSFRCRRLFALMEAGILPDDAIDAEAVRIGTLGHVGLAHIHESWRLQQQGMSDDLLPWRAAMLETATRLGKETNRERGWADALAIAGACVQAWEEEHPEPPGEILMVESTVEGWLGWLDGIWGLWESGRVWDGPSATYGGFVFATAAPDDPIRIQRRLDLVYRNRNGIHVVDHKCKGWATAKRVQCKYRVDGQFSPIRILARQLWGSEFRGVKINTLKTSREKTGRYASFEVELPPAPHLDAGFPTALYEEERYITDLQSRLAVNPSVAWWERPAMHEEVCTGDYGDCPAVEFCLNGDTRR